MAAKQLSRGGDGPGGSEGDGVRLRFVLPRGKNEATCSDELSEAFSQCHEHDINPAWVTEDEVLQLMPEKTDVFILDPFEGLAFEHVCKSRSMVLGPRCLLTCLEQGVTVPPFPYPMYTASMMGLVITSTNFDRETKNKLQHYVESMAGVYSNSFHDGVTHLVAAAVRSRKYDVAIDKGIPVMIMDWVTQAYERGKHENVRATDAQFSKHTCPALLGLIVCVSQMNRKDKEIIKKNIECHGGIYSPTLDMQQTTILILPQGEGDKYEYAKKWKIPCVQPQWVFDSIDKGYCLPTESYRVEVVKMSTPEKADVSKFGDVSHCSTICAPPDVTMTVKVNETLPAKQREANMTTLNKNNAQGTEALLKKLDLDRLKRAGKFLQGCKILLSGFSEGQETHLHRVLTAAGASRMNQIVPSVSHVIVGDKPNAQHAKLLKQLKDKPHLVSLQWLVESTLMSATLPESDFHVSLLGPSETSIRKRTMNKSTAEKPSEEAQLTQLEGDMLEAYGKRNTEDTLCNPESSQSVTQTTLSSQQETFFSGKSLYFDGFQDISVLDELFEWTREAGGQILDTLAESQEPDFLVVPVRDVSSKAPAKERVSYLYIEDCLDQADLLPIEYYHKPFQAPDGKPCEGVVLGLTSYVGKERAFISELAEALGMIPQENFSKRDKGPVKASTHLVAPSPEGSKYMAALKWKLPVVTKDWLLACLKEEKWVSEMPFLVGDSSAFTEGKPLPREEKTTKELDDTLGNKGDEDDEVTFKTPKLSTTSGATSAAEAKTPGGPLSLDLDTLRPKPIALESFATTTPSRWASQPSQGTPVGGSQPPRQAEADVNALSSGSQKRKLEGGDNALPFWVGDNAKTPDTPYGAFLKKNPSPSTRKIWKKQSQLWGEIVKGSEENATDIIDQYVRSDQDAKRQRQEDLQKKEEFIEEFDKSMAKGTKRKSFDANRFEDIMEEKLQKRGKSWKNWSQNANKAG